METPEKGEDRTGDLPDAGGNGGLLALPNRVQEDCRLIVRAIKEGWPVPMERRQRILTTLQQIVETDTFELEKIETVAGPDGAVIREVTTQKLRGPNHKNQVAAAKAILAACALDQSDRHHVETHNQRERHHADDVDRGAGEGSKHQTIILNGADAARLLTPPERHHPSDHPPPSSPASSAS